MTRDAIGLYDFLIELDRRQVGVPPGRNKITLVTDIRIVAVIGIHRRNMVLYTLRSSWRLVNHVIQGAQDWRQVGKRIRI